MRYALWAWFGSVALILGALYFQYGLEMRPCQLCIYQRVLHIVAIVIGAYGIWARKAWMFALMGVVLLVGAGIALFHVGVEQHWWEGLQSCTGQTGLSVDDLLATPPARCDEIAWSLFGISMAGWNGILSLIISAFWFMAWKRA